MKHHNQTTTKVAGGNADGSTLQVTMETDYHTEEDLYIL